MYCPYCKTEFKKEVLDCPFCDTPLIKFPSESDTKEPFHPSAYLNDLEEWNRNQYNPGYWTGGNIPPHIKVLSQVSSKSRGMLALISGIFLLGIIACDFLHIILQNSVDISEEILAAIPVNLVEGFLGLLLVWAGIQRLKWFNVRNK